MEESGGEKQTKLSDEARELPSGKSDLNKVSYLQLLDLVEDAAR